MRAPEATTTADGIRQWGNLQNPGQKYTFQNKFQYGRGTPSVSAVFRKRIRTAPEIGLTIQVKVDKNKMLSNSDFLIRGFSERPLPKTALDTRDPKVSDYFGANQNKRNQ